MQNEGDSGTEILSKLGILNSTLESPNKMTKIETRRRAALNMLAASSLSDDSDSEIIFDRNALLNARKRRRRQRSSSTRITNFLNSETLKWKLFCLSCTFLCIGLGSIIVGLTKPDILSNLNSTNLYDYSKLFVFGGFGYFIGSIFVSLIFTRLNAYISVLLLLSTSIPFTTLIIYQTELGNLKIFMLFQGLLFGAIERGAFFIVYGVLKGDKRVLFMFYMAFAIGGALSSVFTTEEVFSRATVISQKAHLVAKREIANMPSFNSTLIDDQAVTRPHSAVGINEDQDTKTRENTEKRKQAQILKESSTLSNELTTPVNKPDTSTTTTTTQVTTKITSPPTTTTTKLPSTTTTPIPTTTQTTPKVNTEQSSFNRARNRHSSLMPSPFETTIKPNSIVDSMSKQMQKGLAQVNTAPRFAYLLIMIISIITVGLLFLGFCACCIRCNLVPDVRVAQIKQDAALSAQIPTNIQVLSIICWFLQALPESILIAFLPHYILNLENKELSSQNNTAFFNCSFWLSVTLFRAFVSACPNIAMSAKWIKFLYLFGIPFCFFFHHIFSETEVFIFIGLFALGFFMNSLPQLTFSWLQLQLDSSPYLLTKYYFGSISLAKGLGPFLTLWILNGSTRGMMTLLTVILLLGLFFFVFLSRSVNPLARQRQIIELTGDINGRKPTTQTSVKQKTRKGQYEALIENQSDEADVEMDYVLAENALGSDSDSI